MAAAVDKAMADTADFSDLFDLDCDLDMLGQDVDIDLQGVETDFLGKTFAQSPPEDKPASPFLGSGVSKCEQSDVEITTVSPQLLESPRAANSPARAPRGPSELSTPSPQPSQGRLPPGKIFVPIPEHISLIRKCSPPPGMARPPSTAMSQVSRHPAFSGISQTTPVMSPNTSVARYSNMGPPAPGPLNVRRKVPTGTMVASPSASRAPIPSRKRKADEYEEPLADGCSRADENPQGKRPKLRQMVPEAQAMWLERQEKEALAQAKEYRRLRNTALEKAEEYKRLGKKAIERYSFYKEKRW